MSDDCKEILRFLHEHWPKINKDQATLVPWFEHKRETARTEASRDLQKEISHLLIDIHDESLDDQSRSREMTVSRTMARFGSLLCALSAQADIQTRAVIRLTRWLIGLTWAIIFLTLYLCYDVYFKSHESRTDNKERNAAMSLVTSAHS